MNSSVSNKSWESTNIYCSPDVDCCSLWISKIASASLSFFGMINLEPLSEQIVFASSHDRGIVCNIYVIRKSAL